MIDGRGDGMADVTDRDRTAAPPEPARRSARPVVLATLSFRIDPAAEEMAVASALEAGVPLIVANMLHLPPYPATVMLVGPGGATLPHEEALDEVRATAARAAALGIRTELLRVSSRHPVRALLELVAERDAGLLVFGPATGRIRGPRLRAAARRVRRDAPCLVWIAPDG
jgi:nucleotide-binding universal stress UspA family protein